MTSTPINFLNFSNPAGLRLKMNATIVGFFQGMQLFPSILVDVNTKERILSYIGSNIENFNFVAKYFFYFFKSLSGRELQPCSVSDSQAGGRGFETLRPLQDFTFYSKQKTQRNNETCNEKTRAIKCLIS